MTKQQTFDTVVRAMLAQGGPSTTTGAGRVCRMRGADGRRCPIGMLIPDEKYDPAMEDTMVQHSMTGEPQISRGFAMALAVIIDEHDRGLAADLMAAHDGAVIEACTRVDVIAPGRTFDRAFLAAFAELAMVVGAAHNLSLLDFSDSAWREHYASKAAS